MSSNYGYGTYDQSSNYGYGSVSTSVGYGASNPSGAYGYYSQTGHPTSSNDPAVGYGSSNTTWSGYKPVGGGYQSNTTPTQVVSSASSVSYPGYYQQTGSYTGGQTNSYTGGQTGSYSNQPSSYTGNQTGSYTGNQPGSYTGNQPGSYTGNQTGSYTANQAGSYTGNQAYTANQAGSYTQASYQTYTYPQTSTNYQTGSSTVSNAYAQTSSAYQTYSQTNTTYQTGSYTGYTPQSYNSTTSLTPQQEKVVREYATQGYNKNQGKHYLKKKNYESQQEFYCEACKVSCGSQLTYKTHLEGKNHKKRLQQLARVVATEPNESQIKCDVCDIHCSSKESYLAHIKGNKHLKTVSLFRRLGKPLPTMTSVVQQDDGGVQVTGPRITFVGGKKLSSTGLTLDSTKKNEPQIYPPGAPQPAPDPVPDPSEDIADVDPVGEELVTPVKNDPRSPLSSFYCGLCECFFNDAMAKIIHCKGRRHRLNYKKKIDPSLKVDPPKSVVKAIQKKKEARKNNFKRGGGGGSKTSNNSTGGGGGGNKKGKGKMEMLRRQEAMAIAYHHRGGNSGFHDDYFHPPPPRRGGRGGRRYDDSWYERDMWEHSRPSILKNPADDKLLSTKYSQLHPTEIEVKVLQKTVQTVESSLKGISDDMLLEKCKRVAAEKGLLVKDTEVQKDESQREIKGVMRVGLYANNLLLRGNINIELVVMCANIPTRTLLHEMTENLPAKLHLSNTSEDQIYHVTSDPKKSSLLVITTVEDVTVTINIILTSTTIKNASETTVIPSSALNVESCLAGLTSLQQTKWFQGMCQGLPSLSITMRIFFDLLRRNPVWSVLDDWLIQVLIQKCIVSATPDYTKPGDIFRRVIECIASGVLLPGYPGLKDPCDDEKDITSYLSAQQRADVTLSAQHYLRLIAFNQLHLILDIEPPADYAPYSLKGIFSNEEEEDDNDNDVDDEGEENGDPSEVKRFKLELND